MQNQTYMSRRGTTTISFSRNRNTVRHSARRLGPVSQFVIVGLIILSFGLIYVAQGTKATSYDYEISAVENEISELEAKKEDLAVEKARLTSIATAKSSVVAAAMEDATVTGYAAD